VAANWRGCDVAFVGSQCVLESVAVTKPFGSLDLGDRDRKEDHAAPDTVRDVTDLFLECPRQPSKNPDDANPDLDPFPLIQVVCKAT
jgi:hypothetical protein